MGRPSKYSPEFREQAVELVKASSKTVAEVARDLNINDTTLGNWVKADRAERGVPDETGLLPLTAAERAELTALRRENAKLRTEREILKKRRPSSRRSRAGDALRLHRPREGPSRRAHPVPADGRLTLGFLRLADPTGQRPSGRRCGPDRAGQDVFLANREVYGAPRVHAELADLGVRVGRKRVARLMRAVGLQGAHRRKRPYGLTHQVPGADLAPDRVDRKFVAAGPNQLWVADVTYIPTTQGWLYLACVTDVFSRMVIGWSMASRRKTDLVVDAVAMAVHRRGGRVPGVIHHSDRGGEYSSHALERELRRHGALASMGSVADCYDNAMAESLFATLECELFDRQPGGRFTSHREAKLAIFEYLEAFYNTRRRHSALGQVSPAAFEAAHTVTAAA